MDDVLSEIGRDLRGAEEMMKSLLSGAAAEKEPPDERRVWPVYLAVEKSIALLKLRLSVERPGRFVVTRKSLEEDWTLLLERASKALPEGLRFLEEGSLNEALESLRTSRNCLRSYLRDRRRVRLRPLN